MAPDTETTDAAPFKLRSLVGNAGTSSNGEKLVTALDDFYPSDLSAAQARRPNPKLTADLDWKKVAKIAGGDIDVRDAVVRGGDLRTDDAWVTYAGYDADGDTVKGAFPYNDLGSSSSDEHISQLERLAGSTAARDHAHSQGKAQAAADGSADGGGKPTDPIASYEDLSAQEIVALMDAEPEKAEVYQALEEATQGAKARKTIMEWEPKPPEGGDGDPPPAT